MRAKISVAQFHEKIWPEAFYNALSTSKRMYLEPFNVNLDQVDTFKPGTICESAEMELSHVPAKWKCRGCGKEIARGEALQCATCGDYAKLASGDEIFLDQIDMEVP